MTPPWPSLMVPIVIVVSTAHAGADPNTSAVATAPATTARRADVLETFTPCSSLSGPAGRRTERCPSISERFRMLAERHGRRCPARASKGDLGHQSTGAVAGFLAGRLAVAALIAWRLPGIGTPVL